MVIFLSLSRQKCCPSHKPAFFSSPLKFSAPVLAFLAECMGHSAHPLGRTGTEIAPELHPAAGKPSLPERAPELSQIM